MGVTDMGADKTVTRASARSGPEQGKHDIDARFRAQPGSLYVVATPLGNLRDMTLRAIDVLATADVIAAEDTRTTAALLRHYGIATHPMSMHAHNEAQRAERVVELLGAGKSVALVSDAGTPAISDPGARLVRAVCDAGFPVIPVPGASAIIAAVSTAGLDSGTFHFAGFLPAQRRSRRTELARLAALPSALVFFEAPHRVRATIDDFLAVFGPARSLIVARELTKTFETITRMALADAPVWMAEDDNRARGEFVLIVDAPPAPANDVAMALSEDGERWLGALLDELPPARAARVVSVVTGVSREIVYARALALKPEA